MAPFYLWDCGTSLTPPKVSPIEFEIPGDSMMTSPKKAKAKPRKAFSDWDTPRITGLLVLADGTVIEGQGFGAEGEAVGEVCFNTAMTGYQEVLTDPSYAGQIVTFTFPHIGNVGTNDDDLETTNLAASAAVKACIVKAPVTEPANYRSAKHFDKWLKTKGIIGLSGVDTRELTNLIRDKACPTASSPIMPRASST